MKKFTYIFLLVFIGFLTACGTNNTQEGNTEDPLQMVKVDLVVPERTEVGEQVTFKALITQGGEEVDDADSVQFEISNKANDQEDGEMIAYTDQKGGTYSISYTFEKDGVYEVQVHVDARGLHVMPVSEIQVGDITVEAESGENAHHEEHSHDSDRLVSVHLNETSITAGEEAELTVHLSKEGSPFTEAEVRFEIWETGVEQHDWIDATEGSPGEYSSTHVFNKSGSYVIKTHVKHSDGTHVHKEDEVVVK